MNDDTADYATGADLTGISSIGAGESVIYIEEGDAAAFKTLWFGDAGTPASLQIGIYSMSGVGLSSGGDAVSIFDSSQALQALVSFGASPSAAPFPTFDNAAGLNNLEISQLSAVGVNGAFLASEDANEIGSPGTIAGVPEPTSALLFVLGASGLTIAQKRRWIWR